MTSPYINTKLSKTVPLYPYQMNNDVYINLKKNLEKSLLGKCYSKFGYVVKIIKILDYKNGFIEAENINASAFFDLTFSCRLCLPLKDTQIICQIDKVNKVLITATNGPILVIITNDRINDTVFFKDNNNNIRYKKENQSNILESQDYIKVTLKTILFHEGDEKIKAIGFMDDVANDEDKKKFYEDQYKENEQQVDLNDYLQSNQTAEAIIV